MIWNRRNSLHFGRPVHPLASLYAMARNYLHKFLVAQELEPMLPLPPILQQWRPPKVDDYKVNFNALAFKASNLASIEVIIRDWRGEAIAALSMPIPLSYNVNELEALACHTAVQFAGEIGLRKVIFEGYSSVVINALSQGSGGFASYGNIIEDILFLAADFQFLFFFVISVMLKEFVTLWPMLLLKRPKTC